MNPVKAVINRLASALHYTPEEIVDGVLAIAFLFAGIMTYDRWWQWQHTEGSVNGALFYTGVALAILLFAPRRLLIVSAAFGVLGVFSLKTAALQGGIEFWLVAFASFALASIIYRFHDYFNLTGKNEDEKKESAE